MARCIRKKDELSIPDAHIAKIIERKNQDKLVAKSSAVVPGIADCSNTELFQPRVLSLRKNRTMSRGSSRYRYSNAVNRVNLKFETLPVAMEPDVSCDSDNKRSRTDSQAISADSYCQLGSIDSVLFKKSNIDSTQKEYRPEH